VVQTEGYSALYAGIGPRMAKIAPACGVMIACYEVRISLSLGARHLLTNISFDILQGVGKFLAKPL